jgi:hypothetical protein
MTAFVQWRLPQSKLTSLPCQDCFLQGLSLQDWSNALNSKCKIRLRIVSQNPRPKFTAMSAGQVWIFKLSLIVSEHVWSYLIMCQMTQIMSKNIWSTFMSVEILPCLIKGSMPTKQQQQDCFSVFLGLRAAGGWGMGPPATRPPCIFFTLKNWFNSTFFSLKYFTLSLRLRFFKTFVYIVATQH